MWSSVNSSDRLSGASLARDSSDTVTPPSVAVRRRPRSRRQLPNRRRNSSYSWLSHLAGDRSPQRQSNVAKKCGPQPRCTEAHSGGRVEDDGSARDIRLPCRKPHRRGLFGPLIPRTWREGGSHCVVAYPWLESCTEGRVSVALPTRRDNTS